MPGPTPELRRSVGPLRAGPGEPRAGGRPDPARRSGGPSGCGVGGEPRTGAGRFQRPHRALRHLQPPMSGCSASRWPSGWARCGGRASTRRSTWCSRSAHATAPPSPGVAPPATSAPPSPSSWPRWPSPTIGCEPAAPRVASRGLVAASGRRRRHASAGFRRGRHQHRPSPPRPGRLPRPRASPPAHLRPARQGGVGRGCAPPGGPGAVGCLDQRGPTRPRTGGSGSKPTVLPGCGRTARPASTWSCRSSAPPAATTCRRRASPAPGRCPWTGTSRAGRRWCAAGLGRYTAGGLPASVDLAPGSVTATWDALAVSGRGLDGDEPGPPLVAERNDDPVRRRAVARPG